MDNRFTVFVRVRPLIQEDVTLYRRQFRQDDQPQVCTQCHEDEKRIYLVRPYFDDREFIFDKVLSPEISQEETYDLIGRQIVEEVLSGYNGTILTYGQTGSGKTHTIFGSRAAVNAYGLQVMPEAGIVPRGIATIFEYIQQNIEVAQFQVTVSFAQIYMEVISDLLSTKNNSKGLQIREDPKSGIFISGLTQISVQTQRDVMLLIREAAKMRSTSQTAMNRASSRSHAILQVFVEQRWIENGPPKRRRIKKGLLTIVDLAGSERLSKSGSEGNRLTEAKMINKSISALGNCVAALAADASGKNLQHVPFRDSKLTRLLTDSLGGNSKTCIYACVGPSIANYDETYSTLLFATRAMNIRTYAKLNENVDFKANSLIEGVMAKNQLLETNNAELKQELQKLRGKFSKFSPTISGEASTFTTSVYREPCNCEEEQRELVSKFTHMVQYLQGEIARLNVVIANMQSKRERGSRSSSVDSLVEKMLTVPEFREKVLRTLNNQSVKINSGNGKKTSGNRTRSLHQVWPGNRQIGSCSRRTRLEACDHRQPFYWCSSSADSFFQNFPD